MINHTSHTLTLHHETYGLKIIPRGSLEAEVIEELLKKHGDTDDFWALLTAMEEKGTVKSLIDTYIPEGSREHFIEEGGHIAYQGFRVPPTFFRRAIRAGNVMRSIRFIERLHKNPYTDNHSRAFDFLESSNLPLSEDGCILAYKSVRNTFFDWHSNSIRYYPGDEPELKKSQVDTFTHSLCSAGLHFCSYGYMESSFFGGSSSRVVLVKVAPEDIASIPTPIGFHAVDSYNNSKGRAFKVKSICALYLDRHEDFVSLNDRLIHADDDELENIVSDYIDHSIPAVENLQREISDKKTSVNTDSMTQDELMDETWYTASIVKVDLNIYSEWIRIKNYIVNKVASILGMNENEIMVAESFISQEAPYDREMIFCYDSEEKTINFHEAVAA